MGSITKKPVKYAVVDAFTDSEFKGNPAAVCFLEEDNNKPNEWLQSVAAEFNISETSYLLPLHGFNDSQLPRFRLRWFTPATEVNLCGHATLAAAHYCFTSDVVKTDTIEFSTLSGILIARKVFENEKSMSSEFDNGKVKQPFMIELDFPATSSTECNLDEISLITNVLGDVSILAMKKTAMDDLFVVLPSAKAVADAQLDFEEIKKCPGRGLIISAAAPPESGFDFFSRFFCPKYGINEDPVCGSAHCALAHYWSKKMGKSDFVAYAASARSGVVRLHLDEQRNRVKLQGKAITVMEGSVVV